MSLRTADPETVKALLDNLVELATKVTALAAQVEELRAKMDLMESRQSLIRQDIYTPPYGGSN